MATILINDIWANFATLKHLALCSPVYGYACWEGDALLNLLALVNVTTFPKENNGNNNAMDMHMDAVPDAAAADALLVDKVVACAAQVHHFSTFLGRRNNGLQSPCARSIRVSRYLARSRRQ